MSSIQLPIGWRRSLPALGLLLAASWAQAQPADPLNPQAPVPAVSYPSSLSLYQRLGDDTRLSWAEAHERVKRIGGWRAYAREAQHVEPAVTSPDPAGSSTPPAPPTGAATTGERHAH